jgi:ATP-binding cassette subfamily B multidrug efflux pump
MSPLKPNATDESESKEEEISIPGFGYFRYYIKRYGKYFWTGVLALAFTDVLDVTPPLIMMKGVDQILNHAPIRELLKTALVFAVLTLLLALVRFHWRMQFGKFHQNVARDLREKIFKKLTRLGPTFYGQNPIGELMSLVTNDVESIRMGMGPGLIVLIDALLYFLTIPPIMISLSLPLTLKTLTILPILPFFIRWLGGVIHRRYLIVQDKFSELSGVTHENIAGIRVVKSYNQEKNQMHAFNKKSAEWRDANFKVAWAETFMHPVMEVCVTMSMVILLFSGTKSVLAGALTVGGFVAFQRYITKMVWPMTAIGWGFSLVSQGRASLKRVDDFLKTPLDVNVVESPNSMGLLENWENIDLNGTIEIKNLNFSYPHSEKQVLKNISLKIEPGDTFGIVGPVGAGKTTLVQLLTHLFKIDREHIFFNGHDINVIPLATLRRHVSLVPQDTFLFSTSVSENMAFGVEHQPEYENFRRIAQIAKIDEEIESLPAQYETQLGERGVNLSGGQKQRMAITRALIRKSPVVIFDDSLSAVDSETENLILNRLKGETQNQTTIIISHRLSSLSQCNKIAVFKNGILEAIGAPRDLKLRSPTYSELLHLQGYR